MIIRERPSALRLFFLWRGSIVPRIWRALLGVAVLSALVVAMRRGQPQLVPAMGSQPFALLGIALSVFLSFRNNACYDRWWEGRRLWGQIIQTARDIARQTAVLPPAARRAILEGVVDFAQAAVLRLRRITLEQARGQFGARSRAPDEILTEITLRIAEALRAGDLLAVEAHGLNEGVTRLSQALVGCERLANTPLPFAYTLLLQRTAYVFCFLLPFGFADSLGWFTPLGTAVVAYTFFGLDALGEELEEPFGTMPNDLPIAAYATMIEITLKQALGDTDLPPMPEPQGYVLA
ncbi:MAG: bestrophin family ion channel [Paracoccus sp. (in: a-proteobacteria)]|uniref:bestrophin family protein n=1 Tax=Paracoccus sp. TaxID=267 RepID=UPI0039E52A79